MAALNFNAAPRCRPERPQRSHAEEVERARSALFAIDPGCDRETWLRIAIVHISSHRGRLFQMIVDGISAGS